MQIRIKECLSLFCVLFFFSGILSLDTINTTATIKAGKSSSQLIWGEFVWTEPYLHEASELGIFETKEKDFLRVIHRDEFICWLVRAKGDKLVENPNPFIDLPPLNPYFSYIMTALSKGYITKGTYFYPSAPLKRYQMGIWLLNAKGFITAQKAEQYAEEPCILAQDGYEEIKAISKEASGKLTLCYQTEYQLLSYRLQDMYRVVKPMEEAILGEAAFGLVRLKNPLAKANSIQMDVPFQIEGLLAWELFAYQSVVQEMVFINQGTTQYKDKVGTYPVLLQTIPTIQNGLLRNEKRGDKEYTIATLKLRKNLVWSTGAPITAEDITLGFYFFKHPAFQDILSNGIDSMVEKAESIDPWTISVTYNEPYIYAGEYVPSLPRKYLETRFNHHLEPFDLNDPNYFNQETEEKSDRYRKDEVFINSVKLSNYNQFPLHAGAYSVYRWSDPDTILLKANPNYISGPPLIDSVLINLNAEEITDWEAVLKNGKADLYINPLGFDDIMKYSTQQTNPEYTHAIISAPNNVWEHIELNVDDEIMSDQKVREALQLAIDRDKLNQTHTKGLYAVSKAIFKYPSYPYQYFTPKEFGHDLEKANQLMTKAGWLKNTAGIWEKDKEVFEITFMTVANNRFREAVQADIAKMWSNFGLKVTIQNTDYTDLFKRVMQGREFKGPTAVMFAWMIDSFSDFYSLLHSDQIPREENDYAGQNYTGYENKTVDTLLTENQGSMDIEKIHKNMARIAKKISYDVPFIPLFYRSNFMAVHKNMCNIFVANAPDMPITWNCAYWFKKE